MEQGSKFSSLAEEIGELKSKVSVVESVLEETHSLLREKLVATQNEGATSPIDLSIQSELRSDFVALKEAFAQIRSDLAAQTNKYEDLRVQQEIDSLRERVCKLQTGPPAALTLNMGLEAEESIQKLRAEMGQRFTSLEHQTHLALVSHIANNMDKAERLDKLVDDVQKTKSNADWNQEEVKVVQESRSNARCLSAFLESYSRRNSTRGGVEKTRRTSKSRNSRGGGVVSRYQRGALLARFKDNKCHSKQANFPQPRRINENITT